MYQALYRKWRPRTFDDVVSQPHITTTLKNQIIANKTAHAYLFTGSRGTGKTTCARIFAKAVNCENGRDGMPCCECEICRAADNGSLGDIIEIDAASNASVNDIRELREGVMFTPEMCRYKVYIIDEVHMLSVGAFNALLKTMEEPPPHVKFILATTEIQKVPATIVSRCQHFDFNRIKTEDIVARLTYIASQEGFTLHEDAAELIARLSDGGMRDALSLLDQCVAFSDDITLETVSGASGIAGRDHLFDILECIADRNAVGALKKISELHAMSKDLKVLAGELLEQMRNVMLAATIDNGRELITCLPEELTRIEGIAQKMSLGDILGCISLLQESSERFAKSTSKRIELEMCIIRLCTGNYGKSAPTAGAPSAAGNMADPELLKRLARLEDAVRNGAAVTQDKPADAPPPKPEPDPDFKKMDPSQIQPIQNWAGLVEEISRRSPAISGFLKKSKAFMGGSTVFIIVDNDFFFQQFKKLNVSALIGDVLKENFGQTFNIKAKSARNVSPDDKENPINRLLEKAKALDIEVDIKK
ncbi:DNA polymerase III subunit gamma/tau [Ruminococcus sp.]|uniref:DNA polymerase III subunit gamma/tau n=1 Tax=Ruminococcus sp. TaxID=41978 RepID=UPI0025FB8E1A|nr:DNA polymerase III subunit gamma/tau [Ruminococcus sp.]MBQ8965799.1 DNA polymerase III subunit gamma/tau [Ruminococcus sp.]